jgi:hypothetical protein
LLFNFSLILLAFLLALAWAPWNSVELPNGRLGYGLALFGKPDDNYVKKLSASSFSYMFANVYV